MAETERAWLEGGTEENWLEGRDVSEGAPTTGEQRPPGLLHSPPAVFAVLSCSHSLLWDDPDGDVNGSFWCRGCGGYFRIESFR